MEEKGKGIVLHRVAYSDSKNIIKVYTEKGLTSFISVKAKKNTADALQPMTLINYCSQKKQNANFSFLKDIQYVHSVNQTNFHLNKSCVSMFLNEFLYKLLHNAGEDETLFDFMYTALDEFYAKDFQPDFHLRFLVHCASLMGAMPLDNYREGFVFNAFEARFEQANKINADQQALSQYFYQLFHQALWVEEKKQWVPTKYRNDLLDLILQYFSLHICDMSQLKSLPVLKSILHD